MVDVVVVVVSDTVAATLIFVDIGVVVVVPVVVADSYVVKYEALLLASIVFSQDDEIYRSLLVYTVCCSPNQSMPSLGAYGNKNCSYYNSQLYYIENRCFLGETNYRKCTFLCIFLKYESQI